MDFRRKTGSIPSPDWLRPSHWIAKEIIRWTLNTTRVYCYDGSTGSTTIGVQLSFAAYSRKHILRRPKLMTLRVSFSSSLAFIIDIFCVTKQI